MQNDLRAKNKHREKHRENNESQSNHKLTQNENRCKMERKGKNLKEMQSNCKNQHNEL